MHWNGQNNYLHNNSYIAMISTNRPYSLFSKKAKQNMNILYTPIKKVTFSFAFTIGCYR